MGKIGGNLPYMYVFESFIILRVTLQVKYHEKFSKEFLKLFPSGRNVVAEPSNILTHQYDDMEGWYVEITVPARQKVEVKKFARQFALEQGLKYRRS